MGTRDRQERFPRVRLGQQMAIVAAAVAVYFLVRGATEGAILEALGNAGHVVAIERLMGIHVEQPLQALVAGSSAMTTVLNWIYIWGHWPVIVVTLVWLARRHPSVYYRTRDAMLTSGAIGLVVFITFPVAPPRLAGLGMIDTVSVGSHAYRILQPAMLTNQYAAVPSLHVGWDLLMGLAIAMTTRTLLVRVAAMAMPAAMAAAVILTANHYIIDVIAGACLATGCWIFLGRRHRVTAWPLGLQRLARPDPAPRLKAVPRLKAAPRPEVARVSAGQASIRVSADVSGGAAAGLDRLVGRLDPGRGTL